MLNNKTIIVKKVLKSVIALMTMTMLISILGMMIDGIIIGRFLGADRTAAYGLVAPVLIIASLFGGLLSSGTVTQLSQHKAKGETEAFNRTFSMVLIEGMIISAVFVTIVWVFRYPISVFLGASGDKAYLQEYMLQYVTGLLPALPFLLLLELMNQVVQLDGDKKLPMIGVIVMLVTDVVLDLMNVYIFKMDLFGMAFATTISYYASAMVMLIHFLGKKCKVRFTVRELPWNKSWELLVKGAPNAMSRLMSTMRTLCINKILVVVASSIAVAAFSVNNSAGNIMTAIGNGVASSCVMIAGIFIADRDVDSLKSLLANALKYAFILSAVISIIFFIFSSEITGLFLSGNDAAVQEASKLIRYYSIFVPFYAVNSVFYSYLQGIQNVKYSTIICAVGNGGLVIICAFILGNIMGAEGVWMAFPISAILSIIAIYIAAWVYQGHMPRSFDDLTFLPEHMCVDGDNMIEASVTDPSQIIEYSDRVRTFCIEKGADSGKANKCALCIEEILMNTFTFGCKGVKNPCVNTRVVYENNTFSVRFMDNCHAFNPKDYFENDSREDITQHLGLKMVFSRAADIRYTNVLQLNNLIVTY